MHESTNKTPDRGSFHHYRPHELGFNPLILRNMIGKAMGWMPYDVSKESDNIVVTMPLPGFNIEDITLSVKKNELMVEAKKDYHDQKEGKLPENAIGGKFFWDRPISMKITTHQEIPIDKIKASLKKGLLRVRFPVEKAHKVHIEPDES